MSMEKKNFKQSYEFEQKHNGVTVAGTVDNFSDGKSAVSASLTLDDAYVGTMYRSRQGGIKIEAESALTKQEYLRLVDAAYITIESIEESSTSSQEQP